MDMMTWTRGHSRRAFSLIIIAATIVVCIFASCSKEGPAGPQGPPGQNGQNGGPDDLSNPNVQPQVVFTYPPNSAIGPFEIYRLGDSKALPHFVVRFNKLIDLRTVTQQSVTVTGFRRVVGASLYRTSGYPILEPNGPASEFYDHVLAFSIMDSSSYYKAPYPVAGQITVRLDTTITDINGRRLLQPFAFSYIPEPTFRLVSMYPANGATGLYGDGVRLYFNSRVTSSIYGALQISPQVEGKWIHYGGSYYDSAVVYFTPIRPFGFGTTWTVSVSGAARDAFGNVIAGSFAGSFNIRPFVVTATYPRNGDVDVSPSSSSGISVSLSGPYDSSSVRTSFSITPAIPGTFQLWGRDYFYFIPVNGFAPGTRYSVTISTGLRAVGGSPLSSSHAFAFTTAPFSISLTPAYGTFNYPRTERLTIYSVSRLDTNTVRSAITISPAVAYRVELSPPGYSPSASISPVTTWAANTTYTFTVGTTLRTVSGAYLPEPKSTSFTTGL